MIDKIRGGLLLAGIAVVVMGVSFAILAIIIMFVHMFLQTFGWLP